MTELVEDSPSFLEAFLAGGIMTSRSHDGPPTESVPKRIDVKSVLPKISGVWSKPARRDTRLLWVPQIDAPRLSRRYGLSTYDLVQVMGCCGCLEFIEDSVSELTSIILAIPRYPR